MGFPPPPADRILDLPNSSVKMFRATFWWFDKLRAFPLETAEV